MFDEFVKISFQKSFGSITVIVVFVSYVLETDRHVKILELIV